MSTFDSQVNEYSDEALCQLTASGRRDAEEVLVKRYETQFRYYRRALEQMKKKPVKECFLYSLSLQKAVSVDMGRLEFRDAAV